MKPRCYQKKKIVILNSNVVLTSSLIRYEIVSVFTNSSTGSNTIDFSRKMNTVRFSNVLMGPYLRQSTVAIYLYSRILVVKENNIDFFHNILIGKEYFTYKLTILSK